MRYSKVLRIVVLLFENSCNQQIHLIFERNLNLSGSQLTRRGCGAPGYARFQVVRKGLSYIVEFWKLIVISLQRCDVHVRSAHVPPTAYVMFVHVANRCTQHLETQIRKAMVIHVIWEGGWVCKRTTCSACGLGTWPHTLHHIYIHTTLHRFGPKPGSGKKTLQTAWYIWKYFFKVGFSLQRGDIDVHTSHTKLLLFFQIFTCIIDLAYFFACF